jgi:hypothetical protein
MRPASWWSATMKWQDIRDRFPHRWLVLEALKSRREEGKWIVDDMSVMDCFEDGFAAMRRYHDLHREFPQREFFFFHSDRDVVEIEEIRSLGLRV